MPLSRVFLATGVLLSVLGCNVDTEPKVADQGASDTYNLTPVSGVFSGANWTVASGMFLPSSTPGEENKGTFTLYSSTFENVCADNEAPDKKALLWSTEAAAGEKILGPGAESATFTAQSTGTLVFNVSLNGKFSLDSVSDTSISGKIIMYFDPDNSVNGTFTVSRCCTQDGGATYELCRAGDS
jgi:hypothetical protein